MTKPNLFTRPALGLFMVLSSILVNAQQPTQTPAIDDVLRISTNLIQTGFTVNNKKGEFVNGLKKEDFELRVDGKPITTVFFDQITDRRRVVNKTDGSAPTTTTQTYQPDQRRTMVFVVDDLHLAGDSLIRTRRMILKFIDEEVMPNDRVAIVSSGGKVGFLQQLTSDKVVLRAAANRLVYNGWMSLSDRRPPPMDEFSAQSIQRGDREVTDYFRAETARVEKVPPYLAETMVQARSRQILYRAQAVTSTTLSALEAAIRHGAPFRGRKAVYFVSDGFLLDPGNSDTSDRLKTITDAAARSNTVIYSFDAKGLDASVPEDGTALSYRILAGSRFEAQDGLSYVANNTGGKFVHNTNGLQEALTTVVAEAFTYYLLAWEPEIENAVNPKLKKIEVVVKNRPELKVAVNNGYLATRSSDKVAVVKQSEVAEPEKEPKAPTPPKPVAGLRTALAVRYLDMPDSGPMLSSTIQIGTESIEFTDANGTSIGKAEIKGTILDSNGKLVKEFALPVDIKGPSELVSKPDGLSFNYDHETTLKPGLYQVKITTRDPKSGKNGSAFQWIEIPDLSTRRLTLSSLVLGERRDDSKLKPASATPLERKVENRFERTSSLRFMGFVYNASGGKPEVEPDISIKMQIVRQGAVILSGDVNLVPLEAKDNARIPFAGEAFLDSLTSGFYELKLVVTDKRVNKTVETLTRFEVL